MTPQLQQAIRLLQLSSAELDAEIAEAVESNPLLDWVETSAESNAHVDAGNSTTSGNSTPSSDGGETEPSHDADSSGDRDTRDQYDADQYDGAAWTSSSSPGRPDMDHDRTEAEQVAEADTLRDHLLWQLHLSHLSPRDRQVGVAVIEAIDEDGYLREPLDVIAASLAPDIQVGDDEISTVLHQIQCFDPPGVGARDLGECLRLQLALLPDDTAGKAIAEELAGSLLQRLPKIGSKRLAAELGHDLCDVETGVHLLRSLDPRPGASFGAIPSDAYVAPDVLIWREHGTWQVRLENSQQPRVAIQHGYERMIEHAGQADANYLRGHLQEARWLLKNIQARGETLLKVVACILRQQAAFLEFGDQALRPLTLREVANEIGLHESTVSRAVSRKYARTPRGTIALRRFFASGIDTGSGGEASSTAIQAMLRRLIEAEDPHRPLSDARLADALKTAGVPVARRTVAKYREAMGIATSQDRVRMG